MFSEDEYSDSLLEAEDASSVGETDPILVQVDASTSRSALAKILLGLQAGAKTEEVMKRGGERQAALDAAKALKEGQSTLAEELEKHHPRHHALLKRSGCGKQAQIGRVGSDVLPGNSGSVIYDTLMDPAKRRKLGIKTIRKNLLSDAIELDGEDIKDTDITLLINETERRFSTISSKGDPVPAIWDRDKVVAQLAAVALRDQFHPVRDYLADLEWDGHPRIRRLLGEAMALFDEEITENKQLMLQRWLISAIARAMEPGCKADVALILRSDQGAKKSTFFKALFSPQFFADSSSELGSRDSIKLNGGCWCWEMGELSAIRKSSTEKVKQELSRTTERYVEKYQVFTTKKERGYVICGTTNEKKFLNDPTGARRFSVLDLNNGVINLALVREWRDQIWAEAKELYRTCMAKITAGEEEPPERWWFTREEDLDMAPEKLQFSEEDAWQERLEGFLVEHGGVEYTSKELLEEALELRPAQYGDKETTRLRKAMVNLEYASVQVRDHGIKKSVWRKQTPYDE